MRVGCSPVFGVPPAERWERPCPFPPPWCTSRRACCWYVPTAPFVIPLQPARSMSWPAESLISCSEDSESSAEWRTGNHLISGKSFCSCSNCDWGTRGFLKKLPAVPRCFQSGNLEARIAATVVAMIWGVISFRGSWCYCCSNSFLIAP